MALNDLKIAKKRVGFGKRPDFIRFSSSAPFPYCHYLAVFVVVVFFIVIVLIVVFILLVVIVFNLNQYKPCQICFTNQPTSSFYFLPDYLRHAECIKERSTAADFCGPHYNRLVEQV